MTSKKPMETGKSPVSLMIDDHPEGAPFGCHLFEIDMYRQKVSLITGESHGLGPVSRRPSLEEQRKA